ncbi:uncharacterized protein LOC127832064 [Dreissena polymorpha]|uniref:uncharacterized protein LOC127832064 n=1 Tax=Dreissena polymorpha TaxID=45954 RepID=UPI0022647D62|nr:uncharacterized protein LOC127832064 [Dreissena polymorpha]
MFRKEVQYVQTVCAWSILLALSTGSAQSERIRFVRQYRDHQRQVSVSEKGFNICDGARCQNISIDSLRGRFPGLFPKLDEYASTLGLPILYGDFQNMYNTSNFKCPADGDDCCPTYKCIVPNDFRKTIHTEGEKCFIMQAFTIGTCGISANDGSCKFCVQDDHVLFLLAFDFKTWTLSFKSFKIESYCSCKAL